MFPFFFATLGSTTGSCCGADGGASGGCGANSGGGGGVLIVVESSLPWMGGIASPLLPLPSPLFATLDMFKFDKNLTLNQYLFQ